MKRDFVSYPFTAERHLSTLPAMDGNVERREHPIVIVGGGPVGYCAALGLANHGVPVVLLEADDSVCTGSRAICISRRSLQIIERLGALDGFLKVGLPWTGGRSFYRSEEVLHFSMPTDKHQKLSPMINLAQYSIEQILLDRAKQLSHLIDIRWSARVTGIDSRSDCAILSVETPAGNYKISADWVVAADGGRSFLREALGLQLQGTSYEGRYVIVDILLDSQRPTERLAYFDPPCNPGSTVLVHKQPQNVWRIDYQLRDGEDPEEAIKPENVMPRVASLLEMMGESASWQPIWTGIYKANALTLSDYRYKRVLFAGDAAHLLPIFGVRGANSGIDDADNLAWKLAFVVEGTASEHLLDSYSIERVAAAHENLSHGAKSTEFMAPPSFAFELMRTAVLSLAATHHNVRSLINPRQTSAITYGNSPLNAPSSDGSPFSAGPAPGQILSECPIAICGPNVDHFGYLTDLLKPSFTALYFCDEAIVPLSLRKFAANMKARSFPFEILLVARNKSSETERTYAHDSTGHLFQMYQAGIGTVYLARPDGHVLGRWRKLDAMQLTAALSRVVGCHLQEETF